MLDFLLPATDEGVAAQLLVWAVISVGALLITRRNKDLRLLAIGLSVLILGLMGLRMVH
jgi:hypothetical protein